ncbi:MAG TPA: PaaI family thioesterase [Spirochaetia bacterium]|nr:PaaI family thioesterase [Spirochaetia bacterium]
MDSTVERDGQCFCCGADNDKGLHLTITYPEKGSAETSLEIPPYFSGWKKMTHGGFLATILDEIMAHACVGISQRAVTAEMTVRYQKTVEIGTHIRAVGKVQEARGRVLNTRGWIYDEEGTVAAEATARFIATTHISRSSELKSSE